ncbi:hypothetical protein GLYMA_07G267750v4 [Glycine max]|nr:hypothetical protein GLYMA_07G267750v4 [Glycine max]KAH1088821.1 hypothetical protein GYH30_019703 [Glycine max]
MIRAILFPLCILTQHCAEVINQNAQWSLGVIRDQDNLSILSCLYTFFYVFCYAKKSYIA